jgi:hypothetical protein
MRHSSAVGGGGAQAGLVRQRQRLQADAAVAQRDGFDKGHRRLLGLFQPASRAWRQRRRRQSDAPPHRPMAAMAMTLALVCRSRSTSMPATRASQ